MNDNELLKLLGLNNKTIDITFTYELQKQVEQIVNDYLKENENKEIERREKFYKELLDVVNKELKNARNSIAWYGRTY